MMGPPTLTVACILLKPIKTEIDLYSVILLAIKEQFLQGASHPLNSCQSDNVIAIIFTFSNVSKRKL